jgi:hypothetical protein
MESVADLPTTTTLSSSRGNPSGSGSTGSRTEGTRMVSSLRGAWGKRCGCGTDSPPPNCEDTQRDGTRETQSVEGADSRLST